MKRSLLFLLASLALTLGLAPSSSAQEDATVSGSPAQEQQLSPKEQEFTRLMKSIRWTTTGDADIGGMAKIHVPQGYRVAGSDDTQKLMELYGNIVSGAELAYISPDDMSWFALFEFDPVGYVKDDEKDKLNADEILKQLKEGQKAANEQLTQRGQPTLEVLGWKKPPFYNPATNNLEWAIRLRSSAGGEVLNYKTKILGRHGVMDVVLVCDDSQIDGVLPIYQNLLTGYSFKKENSYASFVKGDKVAEYGLTGLIVGGGLLAAAKSGLLTKLFKPLIVAVVAVGAFIKKIFTGRTGTTKDSL